jgi:hypothetical protein
MNKVIKVSKKESVSEKMKEMEFLGLIDIGPKEAEELLKTSNGNRPVSQRTIRSYASDMANGYWEVTHQSMAINKNGNLVDGHSRCAAVILSGSSIRVPLFQYDDSRDAIGRPLDLGKKRTMNDITGIPKSLSPAFVLFYNIYYGQRERISHVSMMEIHKQMFNEIQKVEGITGYAFDKPNVAKGLKTKLYDVYNGVLKCALLLLLIEGKERHAKAVRDLHSDSVSIQHINTLYNILKQHSSVTRNISTNVRYLTVVYHLLRYKELIDLSDEEMINVTKIHMMKILESRFPEIFKRNRHALTA